MADREIVTKIVVTAEGVTQSTTAAATGLNKVKQAAGETARVIDQLGSTSTARLKARLDSLSVSFDSVSAAEHKFAQETLRTQRMVDEGVKRGLQNEQQAARIMTQLRDRQIAELNRLRAAKLQTAAVNDNQVPGGRGATAAGINVAYQFQDITMMAAAGQPVMMTALQQGTQLAGILASVDAKGGSMFKTLTAGFASLISWQSLVAIGLVGLTAAVIKYGVAWFTAGEDTKKSLEEQAAAADRLIDKYGQQIQLIKDLRQAEKERQEQAELAAETNRRVAETRAKFLKEQSADLRGLIPAYGAPGPGGQTLDPMLVNQAATAAEEFEARLAAGTLTQQDFDTYQKAINATLADSPAKMLEAAKALGILKAAYDQFNATQQTAIDAQRTLSSQGYAGQGGVVSPRVLEQQRAMRLAEQYRLMNQTQIPELNPQIMSGGLPVEVPVPDTATLLERNQERQDAIEKTADAAEKAAQKEADALEKVRKETQRLFEAEQKRLEQARDFVTAQEDKQAASELELQTFGMEEDARTRLLAQLQAEQELRKTNVELTQEQADAYRAAAAATAENKIALKQLKEDQDAFNDAQTFMIDQGKDLFGNLIEGGEKFADVLKRIIENLADAVLQAVLLGQGPLAGLFGTKPAEGVSVGGIIGTILGNKAATGGGTTATQQWVSGTGWAGARTTGPVGVDMMTTGATTAAQSAFQAAGTVKLTGANLVSVPFAGKMIQVDARYAGQFAALGQNLMAAGYPVTSVGEGGYSHRRVAGTSSWSQHAYGQAVDVNPAQNPYAYGARGNWGQFNVNASRMAQNVGLEYGGDWRKPDTMHFQVSRNAQQAAANLQKFNQSTQVATQGNVALAQSSQQATGGLGSFGQALSQIGGGGGGGGGGWLQNIFSMFGGQGFGGGGFHAGSFIGGGGFTSSLATGWATRIALGAAFSGGNIIPFARGGIVDGPMLFPMARGAGLMGEAGPEAVMPLTRGTNGKLGVAMSGGNTGVVIHNYSTAEVKPRENQEGTGWEFIIEDRTADRINTFGTPLNKSVRNAAGSRLKRR